MASMSAGIRVIAPGCKGWLHEVRARLKRVGRSLYMTLVAIGRAAHTAGEMLLGEAESTELVR